jgi:hypothetical protein
LDAWTSFGLLKLFLDVIDGGTFAAVKGVLMMGVPYSGVLDAGEVIYGLFNLNGNYEGVVILRDDQYIPFQKLELLNQANLISDLKGMNFPEIAKLQFTRMAKMDTPDLTKLRLVQISERKLKKLR